MDAGDPPHALAALLQAGDVDICERSERVREFPLGAAGLISR